MFANVRNAPYNAVGDGVADDSTAIINAISACPTNQVVYLPAGTYRITRPIRVKSGVTVRGDGIAITTVKGSSAYGYDWLIGFENANWDYDYTDFPSRNLTAGLGKGSTNITTSAAHGWFVGDVLLIDQLESPTGDPPITNDGNSGACTWCGRAAGDRPIGQWVQVVAVPNSTTAVIDPPLHWNYDVARTPQAVKANNTTQLGGVESMTVDNSASGARDTMYFHFAVNCWADKVEMKGSYRRMVDMYGALWCSIRSCTIHDGVPATPTVGSQYGSNRGYGVFMGPWPTACLVENNAMYSLSFCVSLEGAPSGNVIAYNFFTNLYYVDNDWVRTSIGHHGSHPKMNLIEGNVSGGYTMGGDPYWGTSSHSTFFRNRQWAANKIYGTWGIDLYRRVHYFSFIGNVLGSSTSDTYELENDNFSYGPGEEAIFKLGYYDGGDDDAAGNDPQVKATIYRHGNWDTVNNRTLWDPSNTDTNIPPSLYLSSKPSWWGNSPWPAIGPDLNPMMTPIPAQLRYNAVQAGGTKPSAPVGVQAVAIGP